MTTRTCADENEIEFVVEDTYPSLPCVYRKSDNTPIDITGYTFKLHISYDTPSEVTGSIISGPDGEFIFEFIAGDINKVGKFKTEIVIIDTVPKQITYQFLTFNIKPRIMS
jgi:hypothetical protein